MTRALRVLLALVALTSSCASLGGAGLDDTVDGCTDVCGTALLCAIAAPLVVAGCAGCVVGGCTRVFEEENDDGESAEIAPGPTVARAMGY